LGRLLWGLAKGISNGRVGGFLATFGEVVAAAQAGNNPPKPAFANDRYLHDRTALAPRGTPQ
jgi:hypothetical protein